MKKVIFVGGTSFSGSTFLHLTLGNDPHGFAGGEIRHLFHPTQAYHVNPNWGCGCDDPDCRVWDQVRRHGEDHLYETIFDEHPDVNFIVDSSKNIVWTQRHTERLLKQGIDAQNLLIWKTPLELAASLKKRRRLGTLSSWTRYHRLYVSMIPEWRAVPYRHYAQDTEATLEDACEYVGISYFPGKEEFWQKTHHVLGGNLSARIHLYSSDSSKFADTVQRAGNKEALMNTASTSHQQIYYKQPDDPELLKAVADLESELPITDRLEEMLEAYDVAASISPVRSDWSNLFLPASDLRMKYLKQAMGEKVNQLKWSKPRS